MTDDNPLLSRAPLPAFRRIRPEQVEPAIDHLLARNRSQLKALGQIEAPTWENFVEPLEEIAEDLERTWSPVNHLNAVQNSEALRAAYNACLPKLSDYATELGQDRALFAGYRALAEQPDLDATQRQLVQHALRDFRLSGVDLPEAQRDRYRALSAALSQQTAKFSENLLDATQAWTKHIQAESQLDGLPDSARALARQQAEQRGLAGWLLTLEFPSYLPVMTYAKDRSLRRELYTAYCTRASDQGPYAGRWDNGPLMEAILAKRHEMANLLGYANYAELSLARKMAPNPRAVLDFLEDLAERALPQARQELEELSDYARAQGCERLEAWDLPYYSEQLRQHRYAISQEALRPYFPLPRVLQGLFQIAERLFQIRIQEVQGVETWHPDVRFFAIRGPDGAICGQFYLDPYARENKRGGAWMDVCTNRIHTRRYHQLPVAYLVCNFTPPVGDRPALLTHEEVETLFHEFGHGLHHLLTRVDYPSIGGINGVPWDAVELPSQFLENWCWARESLDQISGHVETGQPLPEERYQRMQAAKHFQSALALVRQLEFALFDFRIHREYDPKQGGRVQEILDQVRDQVSAFKPPAFNRFAHGFSHIFSGGYAAGYYSYLWAEVLAADAFSLFEERGLFDRETGQAFRSKILERGGSRDAMELFVDFRGRPPQVEALLRHRGIGH